MRRFCTLMSKLLNLCNSPVSFSVNPEPKEDLAKVNLLLKWYIGRSFILKIYRNEKARGFQINILVVRSGEYGKKVSNDF